MIKEIIDNNGKRGSIPFSGKWIPPGKVSNQYANKPSNKAFIKMLILFSKVCLLRSLKLRIAMNPTKTSAAQTKDINGTGPKREKSCAVTNKKMAPKIDKKIQTVCILCNMVMKLRCKNSDNFLHNSIISVDLHYNWSENRRVARLNLLTFILL